MKNLLLIFLFVFMFTSTCFAKVIKIGESYIEIDRFISIKCELTYTSNSIFEATQAYAVFGYTGEATDNWFSGQKKVKLKLSKNYVTEDVCKDVLDEAFRSQ